MKWILVGQIRYIYPSILQELNVSCFFDDIEDQGHVTQWWSELIHPGHWSPPCTLSTTATLQLCSAVHTDITLYLWSLYLTQAPGANDVECITHTAQHCYIPCPPPPVATAWCQCPVARHTLGSHVEIRVLVKTGPGSWSCSNLWVFMTLWKILFLRIN